MRKEIRIKPVHFMKNSGPHKHGGSGCPEYGLAMVVLSFIRFTNIKYPSPGKRIAKVINPTTGYTCILKRILLLKSQQFGLCCSNALISLHQLNYRCYPIIG